MEKDLSIQILSDIIIYMKYARYLENQQRRETWVEIIDRNKAMHIKKFPQLIDEINQAYEMVYDKKVVPSMRSLQFAGKPIELNPARMFNCSAVAIDNIEAFSEIMFLLLSGCGVGYSVQLHHIKKLPLIKKPIMIGRKKKYLIDDSIIGWASAIKVLMKSYFEGTKEIDFDYRDIRAKGERLITSGGKAPGAQPLKDCVHNIKKILDRAIEERGINIQLKSIEVHDIICYIADAVLSGGIRRSACISLFSFDDNDMLESKFNHWWELNPQRARANNSIVLVRHKIKEEEFKQLWDKIKESNCGEPGFFFTNDKNYLINPCSEISLKSMGVCNLTSINVSDVIDQKDFNDRCKVASFIGTIQASYMDFHYLRDEWREQIEKEALIGVSMTGVASKFFLENINIAEGANEVKKENNRVAKLIGINKAYRTTTCKPEGCRPFDGLVTTNKGIKLLYELFKDHEEELAWSNIKEDINAIQKEGEERIIKSYNNGLADIFGIEIEGQILLESTKNHPWFIKEHYEDKGRIHTIINNFKLTEDIIEGDIVDISLGIYKNEKHYIFKNTNMFSLRMKDENRNLILQPKEMTSDLAWLIGYLWGDGSLSEHKYRLRFIDQNLFNIQKVQRIIKDIFNLNSNYLRCSNKDAYTIDISSIELYTWLADHGIRKYSNSHMDYIPECVRSSSYEDIIAFIAGFCDADGCISLVKGSKYKRVIISQSYSSGFTRHLQNVAMSVGLHFNHSFNRKGRNFQSEKDMILLCLNSFSKKYATDIFEKYCEKAKNKYSEFNIINETNSKSKQLLGKVKKVYYIGKKETYDVEVENTHTFYAGAIKSHNTVSLVMGTSSGVHAWHSPYYVRRVRVGKEEAIYQYLKLMHPEILEDDFFKPEKQAVISIPIKAPENSIYRYESAIDTLERVKKLNIEWIRSGHIKGSNYNNVSCTISIKPDEWQTVGNWMWENRDYYNGISIIPYDGGSYKQAPFEEITKEKYEELYKKLEQIDITQIVELENNVDHKQIVACAGGACEIK